jgi:hypothetical protein
MEVIPAQTTQVVEVVEAALVEADMLMQELEDQE